MDHPISQYSDIILKTEDGQFQLMIGNSFLGMNNLSSPLHTHNYYELFFVFKGRMDIGFNDTTVTLQENSLFAVSPGTLHYTTRDYPDSQIYSLNYQYTSVGGNKTSPKKTDGFPAQADGTAPVITLFPKDL